LKRVVFAHRHGARTPSVNVNGSCDGVGCGVLTLQGALMLESLGKSFRERYGAILPNYLDTNRISVVSDDSDRVIQSAAAFAKGLFAYNASYTPLPATHTDSGSVIDPWSQGGFSLHMIPLAVHALANITAEVLTFVSVEQLNAAGAEMGIPGIECDLLPAACVAEEVDFLASMIAEGRIGEFPIGAQIYPALAAARLLFFKAIEGQWDTQVLNNTYFEEAGWPAASLFTSMLNSAKSDGTVLAEFSGHDITLMPLYAAMGNLSFVYPSFATAVVFEVYHDESLVSKASMFGTGKKDVNTSALFVKALVAHCDQLPGVHTYNYTSYALTCMNAAYQTYVTEDGCPFDDLARFASTRFGSKGLFVADSCYGWPHDLEVNGCLPQNASIPNLPCARYRAACPFVACGPGRYMSADLNCNTVPSN
jgi:hypothetical protein